MLILDEICWAVEYSRSSFNLNIRQTELNIRVRQQFVASQGLVLIELPVWTSDILVKNIIQHLSHLFYITKTIYRQSIDSLMKLNI